MVPTVIDSSSAPDSTKPLRGYRIYKGKQGGASRLPDRRRRLLGDRGDRLDRRARARRTAASGTCSAAAPYDFYYNGAKLHMIVLRYRGVSYWVVNSLLDNLSNETMIAIAKGLKPLKVK